MYKRQLVSRQTISPREVIFVDSNSTLFEAAEAKITNQKLYLEGKIFQADKKFQLAYENFKAFTEAGGNDVDYENQLQSLSSDIVNSAIEDNAEKRFIDATSKLYLAYIIFPEQNKDYLYYAASSAVNGKDFDKALKYYNILKNMNYEGIVVRFMATSVETNEEIELSETEYNLYKKTKEFNKFLFFLFMFFLYLSINSLCQVGNINFSLSLSSSSVLPLERVPAIGLIVATLLLLTRVRISGEEPTIAKSSRFK